MIKSPKANRRLLVAGAMILPAVLLGLLLSERRLSGTALLVAVVLLVAGVAAYGWLFVRGGTIRSRIMPRLSVVVILMLAVGVLVPSIRRLTETFDLFALAAVVICAWLIFQFAGEVRGRS